MRAGCGDIEIAYERSGEGDPVLLVQGLATTRIGWVWQMQFLGERYDVTCFDNRGIGESTIPEDAWTMQDMADDAVRLMDALGYGRAHVVGVSMGGMISQEITLRHPDRVRSLTLISTHHGGYDHLLPVPEFMEALGVMDPEERVRRFVNLTYGRRYREENPEFIESLVQFSLQNRQPLRGIMNQLQAIIRWSSEGGSASRLGEIQVPVRVLHGGDDEIIPVRNGELIAEALGAEPTIWPDAGHALIQEHHEEVNAEILRHLERATAETH